MPTVPLPGGGFAIVCTRGGRLKAKPCYACNSLSSKLCDGTEQHPWHRFTTVTCDRPMCDRCAYPAGKNKDYCHSHVKEQKMPVEGLHHVPGFLSPEEIAALIEVARKICTEAPLRRPTMPDGTPLRLTLTNAGDFGWWSDKPLGYRYITYHPTSRKPLPPIPAPVQMLAQRALARVGLPAQVIENCLINHYAPGENLGLHVDRTEDDKDAPIVSLSIGADAEFLVGGRERQDKTEKVCLRSGDLLVQSGESRRIYHGIGKIFPTMGNPLKDGGRLNFTLRKVTKDRPEGRTFTPDNLPAPYPGDEHRPCIGGCGGMTSTGVCANCVVKAHGGTP